MRLSFGQHLQQKQVQTLAPRMIQSMEILQLPIQDLQERIDQELAENPMLELEDADPSLPDEPVERVDTDKPDLEERELIVDNDHNNADDFERLLNLDQEIPEAYDEYTRPSANRIAEIMDRQHDTMANIVDRPESLHEHLLHQLGEMEISAVEYAMCERIISTLNAEDGGYLKVSLPDLLPADATEADLDLAEKCLGMIHTLDPAGVGARGLEECLLLQVTDDMPFAEEMRVLVRDHLDDLYHNRMPAIQKATGFSIETIQSALGQLKKLTPKPASMFAERSAPTIVPDVFVDRDEDGKYRVRLEDTGTRGLHISNYYRKRLATGEATSAEREYIKRRVTSAQWLIESIEQRRATLTAVSQAIVDYQTKFLEAGPEFIEPLKMQQIADQVGVHVTTVSRAVDDKWIQTPRGILPLRRFFVGGTQSDDGEDVAWDRIRIKLQELIDHEDKTNPHSDDDLVKMFKAQGLNVARRTITKYRQKMGIPSSRQRRDWSKKLS
ncbi:MAG: RNA polymerase factor sigma-54 [Planctomycetales bacterium]|nr:RNA polymerase factor sigma-54 [Planctomycetales bacterium]